MRPVEGRLQSFAKIAPLHGNVHQPPILEQYAEQRACIPNLTADNLHMSAQ